jgi:hypothetical protein
LTAVAGYATIPSPRSFVGLEPGRGSQLRLAPSAAFDLWLFDRDESRTWGHEMGAAAVWCSACGMACQCASYTGTSIYYYCPLHSYNTLHQLVYDLTFRLDLLDYG